MAGRVIATYVVRITLREPDDLAEGESVAPAPTVQAVEDAIESQLVIIREAAEGTRPFIVRAAGDRTDG